jgi:O-antigen ligase
MWSTSWKLAELRPLFGAGFAGPYTRDVVDLVDPESPARAVHSIWFEVLGEHGIPTFMIWLALMVAGAIYAQRLIRLAQGQPHLAWAEDLGRMAQVSMVAYCVSGTFLSLSYWDFYWTLLVVVAAAYGLAKRTADAPAPLPSHRGQRDSASGASQRYRGR